MITTFVPESWQDLQTQVGRILAECGFVVEIEKRIPLTRGQAVIDVYAEERRAAARSGAKEASGFDLRCPLCQNRALREES